MSGFLKVRLDQSDPHIATLFLAGSASGQSIGKTLRVEIGREVTLRLPEFLADPDYISAAFVNPGANSSPLVVSVSGRDIVTSLATDAAGAITSTAQQVIDAINADADASALVTGSLPATSTGAGVVVAEPSTNIVGSHTFGTGNSAFTLTEDVPTVAGEGDVSASSGGVEYKVGSDESLSPLGNAPESEESSVHSAGDVPVGGAGTDHSSETNLSGRVGEAESEEVEKDDEAGGSGKLVDEKADAEKFAEKVEKKNVPEINEALKEFGLDDSGRKDEKVERLKQDYASADEERQSSLDDYFSEDDEGEEA